MYNLKSQTFKLDVFGNRSINMKHSAYLLAVMKLKYTKMSTIIAEQKAPIGY